MAGRRKKGAELEERLNKYFREYELDELNEANDMASLTQMCQLEITIDKLQEAINKIKDPAQDAKKIKDLTTALRDVNASWIQLQVELGINRRKRQSEGDETPLSYIDRLREQAYKYLQSRLKVLECDACGFPIMQYNIAVTEKGEKGSIASESKPVEPVVFNFKIECPLCGKVNERKSSS